MSGHTRRRGKNSFELKFDIGPDPLTGLRRTRTQSFKGSKKDAQLKLAALITENARGGYVDTSKTTVSEFIERWLKDWAVHNTSPKTFERYAELLRNHVGNNIGNTHLQKLRPVHLNELYGSLLVAKDKRRVLAPRTVGHVHRALHRALGHAHRWGIVQQNVAEMVTPPRVASTELEVLAPAQVQTVLEGLKGRSVYSVCVIALATGMRRGELLGLRWCDVDLDGATVRVEQSLEQTKAGLRFKAPKTKHGRRRITLPPSAVTVLRDHWKVQQEMRLKLGTGKAPADSLVFPTWDGKPRSPNSLTKEWKEAVARTEGVPRVTLHSLRHTHASHLIAAGLDVLAISRRLGHGSPTITLAVYGHLFPSADDRAAGAIETAFATTRAPGTKS
jgi:integrase